MLNTKVEHLSIEEFLKLKYLEYKDNETSKYFFLYFLHLLGFFDYEEKDGKAEFSNIETSIEVSLPIIDSDDKFNEIKLPKFINKLNSKEDKDEFIYGAF